MHNPESIERKVLRAFVSLLAFAASNFIAAEGTTASARLLAPVFPPSTKGIIWVEGEDAVSTNMATEATLNYSCSNNRSLQLSRIGSLPGGSAYYSEYCVYVDKAGRYELWYAGTPPGPLDEYAISLASPVSVVIDGGAPRPLFREDVNVVERSSPAYYWVRTFSLDLSAGAHVLRFEVSSKRRLDDRYFFYLDALFLASPEALAAAKSDRNGLPDLFPKDPANRRIDHPFRSYEDAQAAIQASPAELAPYIELADEYSLAGNYLDALKTLSRAMVIAPKDPEARLLTAKNRIWRGDVKEGIEAYGIYVSLRPGDLGAYEEAGKVAAWSGRYSDAEYFYATGLAALPGDPSLTVNNGLTLLWAGRVGEAEAIFKKAEKAALADPLEAERLALIYQSNGFSDRAFSVLEHAIAAFPDRLGLYLDEGALLAAEGRDMEAEAVESRIASVFEASPELDAVIGTARARRQLKSDRIAALEARIADKPDDLELRDELTRVYAWNGRKQEAARQLESILAARFARSLAESDAKAADLLAAQFSAVALLADSESRIGALGTLASKAQAAAPATAAGKSAPSTDAARSAMRDALSALADAIGALEAEDARLALLNRKAEEAKTSFEAIASREEADAKAFKTLVAGSGWSFDRDWANAELAVPAARGEQIAAIARARVIIGGGKDYKAALAALPPASAESLAADRRLAELMIDARADYKALYKAATESDIPPLSSASALLAEIAATPAPTASPERQLPSADSDEAGLAAYATLLKEALSSALGADLRVRADAAAARAALASLAQRAAVMEDERLGRAWYAFESKALDLRSELGSYYDGIGEASKATKQYGRVLALDPSNIPAMHALALAEEKAGDWAAAAALFKAVNSADPYFENASARYNGIARRHAPGFDASSAFLADLNLFDYKSDASALFPLSSYLALKPFASVRSIRDRDFGYPAYVAATLGMEAPISIGMDLSGNGIVVRPSASLIGTSADYAQYGKATVTPAQFFGALSVYSAAGLGLDFSSGTWRGSASYSYAPLPDSVNPSSILLYAHRLELSGGSYLPLGGIFRYFAPRVYASGGYVPDDSNNVYGTALIEAIPAFRISDSPWSSLGIPLDLVYEDSKLPITTPYYAADQALTIKGGLLWQSSHSLNGGDVLSLTAEGMGGMYTIQTFSSPTRYPYFSASLKLDWVRSGTTYSLSAEGAITDPLAAIPQYWYLSVVAGISAKQPALIAP